jgi:hypothetical protein
MKIDSMVQKLVWQKAQDKITSEIWGSHSSEYSDGGLLGCDHL